MASLQHNLSAVPKLVRYRSGSDWSIQIHRDVARSLSLIHLLQDHLHHLIPRGGAEVHGGLGFLSDLDKARKLRPSAGQYEPTIHGVVEREEPLDIAGAAPGEASVDPQTCEVSGHGFSQLCASWEDPDFDPDTAAVYYARVLENPSCRWSQHDCLALPEDERPPSCSDPDLPWQIQERAWTSPIWYQP